MPKVSNFTQLPFPLPTTNFTAEGESKAAHTLTSRVLWDGDKTWGIGDPPTLEFMGATIAGSNTIPAGFFNTYRSVLFEAELDMSGIIDGGSGHLVWEASLPSGPVGPTESIPWNFATYGGGADSQDRTARFQLRLCTDGLGLSRTGLTSFMRWVAAKDDFYGYVGQVQYATQPFDGSLSGVSFATPIVLTVRIVYGQNLDPMNDVVPQCYYSRLSF